MNCKPFALFKWDGCLFASPRDAGVVGGGSTDTELSDLFLFAINPKNLDILMWYIMISDVTSNFWKLLMTYLASNYCHCPLNAH